MTQLSLDDCLQATDTAISHAETGAGSLWMDEAMAIIERVARTQPDESPQALRRPHESARYDLEAARQVAS